LILPIASFCSYSGKWARVIEASRLDNDSTRKLTTSCPVTLFSSQVFEFLLAPRKLRKKYERKLTFLLLAVVYYV
jgi:hypothetical protein